MLLTISAFTSSACSVAGRVLGLTAGRAGATSTVHIQCVHSNVYTVQLYRMAIIVHHTFCIEPSKCFLFS